MCAFFLAVRLLADGGAMPVSTQGCLRASAWRFLCLTGRRGPDRLTCCFLIASCFIKLHLCSLWMRGFSCLSRGCVQAAWLAISGNEGA